VAVAFGVRTEGGAFVFPLDLEARMDDRERQLMARMRRLRDLDAEVRAGEAQAGIDRHGQPLAASESEESGEAPS
jgi:hypothetical protein